MRRESVHARTVAQPTAREDAPCASCERTRQAQGPARSRRHCPRRSPRLPPAPCRASSPCPLARPGLAPLPGSSRSSSCAATRRRRSPPRPRASWPSRSPPRRSRRLRRPSARSRRRACAPPCGRRGALRHLRCRYGCVSVPEGERGGRRSRCRASSDEDEGAAGRAWAGAGRVGERS